MIQKALLTTLITLLIYSGLIQLFHENITRTGQTTGHRNTVKAEDYLYEAAEHCDTLIVGSSMSERLIADSIGTTCYNLAFAGLSSQTGLELIRRSGHWPRLIYIETNTLLDSVKANKLSTLSEAPTWQFVRQHLAFMRQKYQPVGVFKAVLRDWQYGKQEYIPFETAMTVDSVALEKAILPQLHDWQTPVPDAELQEKLQVVIQILNTFRQHGTKVVLFEMPIDPRLQQSTRARSVQIALTKTCEANNYPFVTPAQADHYQTTDGIHLTVPESIRYTNYLCEQVRKQKKVALL